MITPRSHSLTVLPADDSYEKKEKCGVFGIWGTPLASQITYMGIFAQQHRGQESAGIAVTTGTDLEGHTGMGLVSQVFTPRMLKEELAGTGAIGHVRYSTTGSSKLCNAQPLLRQHRLGPVAIAHNGNLINAPLVPLQNGLSTIQRTESAVTGMLSASTRAVTTASTAAGNFLDAVGSL